MDDPVRAPGTTRERLLEIGRSYERVHVGYRGVAQMAAEAARKLREGAPIPDVNEILARKRLLLREVREEEERVTGAREWWKRSKRTLPAEECRELLSLLDAIGRTLEETLGHEEECRTLLRERTLWRGPKRPPAETTQGSGR